MSGLSEELQKIIAESVEPDKKAALELAIRSEIDQAVVSATDAIKDEIAGRLLLVTEEIKSPNFKASAVVAGKGGESLINMDLAGQYFMTGA